MSLRSTNALVWFGVLGGPLAWAAQFVASLGFSWAQCNQPVSRWQLPVHAWQIGVGAAGVVVGLAAEAAALRVFLRTRNVGEDVSRRGIGEDQPPIARLHFLATIGLTVNFLALAIMVMTAIGAPLLPLCRQS